MRVTTLLLVAAARAADDSDAQECADTPSLRVGFGSSSHQHKKTKIYKSIYQMDYLDAFIFAGDALHHDTPPCGMPWNPKNCERHDWFKQLMRAWKITEWYGKQFVSHHYNLVDTWCRLNDYHALGKNHVRKVRSGHAHAPILATWDDHDYGLDDAGAEYRHRAESMRQFKEFWRNDEMDLEDRHANGDPFADTDGVYRDYRLSGCGVKGDGSPRLDIHVILLDTRSHRTPVKRTGVHQEWRDWFWIWLKSYFFTHESIKEHDLDDHVLVDDDPAHTMLGAEQWAWLDRVLQEPADVKLVVSSIQVLAEPANGFEAWANFPREKERLVDSLVEAQKTYPVLLLTGDAHYSELSVLETREGGRLLDFTASGLTEHWPFDHRNDRRHPAFGTTHENNFGVVEFRCGADVNVTLEVRDRDADVVVEMSVPLADFSTAPV